LLALSFEQQTTQKLFYFIFSFRFSPLKFCSEKNILQSHKQSSMCQEAAFGRNGNESESLVKWQNMGEEKKGNGPKIDTKSAGKLLSTSSGSVNNVLVFS
jgi:hypothetical protein